MGIQAIPIEIALHIASNLNPEDLFHWALSCRQFGYLIRDNAVCRASLRTRPFSRECQGATASYRYAKGLRTHVKRRAAIQMAQPFSVAIFEGGDSFVYVNGALCYTFGQTQVRLLNFNEPQICDWMFDIRKLLKTRLSQLNKAHRHKFKAVHYAEGLFTCLYSRKTDRLAVPLHWLVVIDVETRGIVSLCELDRIDDLWVRNTREWLYCGISSETEDEETRSWTLFQLDARNGQWAANRIMIPDMPHGDLGIGNCFEIFGQHLYGASSRMPVNFDSYESQEWNSFYYVFRFWLGDPDNVEVMEKEASWRRWPADGNVDDRWGFLQLVKDEANGSIYLYESRREFLEERPQSQRNCYRKIVTFPPQQSDEPRSWVSKEPSTCDSETYRDYFEPVDVHHGDDWYRDTTYKVREAPIRTYIPSCRTYLDVIAQFQDPSTDRPLVHIRARPRDLSDRRSNCAVEQAPAVNGTMEPEPKADHGVYSWPSKQDLDDEGQHMTRFLEMLYPDTTAQQLLWHADERFIIYSVEAVPSQTARHLVIISFDPSVCLSSVKGWQNAGTRDVLGEHAKCAEDVGCLRRSGEPALRTTSPGKDSAPRSFGLDLSVRGCD